MAADRLDKYKSMRDFSQTPEPSGGKKQEGAPTFVVQKHAATALHYDVRFQVDDVMPSWAVPKGPSYDPKVRRLAVQTEDHPLDYQTFEGVIPKGEYGGGEVIVWDRGTYERTSTKPGKPPDMRTSIDNGHFTVMLHGEKLIGEWSLIRTGNENGKAMWMMIKHKDQYVNEKLDITKERPESVTTGRTIEDLQKKALPKATSPKFRRPIRKTDLEGTRCIAVKDGDVVTLFATDQQDITNTYPSIVQALQKHEVNDLVLDGVIDNKSHPTLRIIDILHLLGQSTTSLTQAQRSQLLREAVRETTRALHITAE